MVKQRLIESFSVSKKDIKPIILNESNKKIIHEGKEFDATFAYRFPQWVLDKKNLNGRIYITKLAQKIVKENKVTFGLCNHPSEESDQPDGDVKDIWAVEKDPVIENGILWFSVYLVGDLGKKLVKDILDVGAGIPLSSSGYGEVNRDGTVDVESYDLERYSDFVLNPSYKVYGFADYTENSPVRESVDPNSLSVGNKIKFDETSWFIEKIDGPDHIEVRKANQDSIYKIISAKEIQEVMTEQKIKENSENYTMGYNDYKPNTKPIKPNDKDYMEGWNKAENDFHPNWKDEYLESIDKDKKQEGKSMNKKFSVEEKSFRLNVKNLIKEADSKEDLQEKLESYNEILTWFGEEFTATDLQEDVTKKIDSIKQQMIEFARKGQKTDSLEEQKTKLEKALSEIHSVNKKMSEKYALAAEMLDNLKTFSIKMKELYENQKARANGMVTASHYKEALDAVDILKAKIKEARSIIKKLKEENDEKQKELDKKEEAEEEERKMEEMTSLQKKVQQYFLKEEEEKKVADEEEKKKEEEEKETKKKAEESINIRKYQRDIENYYDRLVEKEPGYKEFKDQILECKTLIEAQKFVMKVKDMIYTPIPRSDTHEFKKRISLD